MRPQARPALRFPLNIDNEKQRLVLSNDTERIFVDGVPPYATATLIDRLNAGSTAGELAGVVYLDQEHVAAILSALHREGLTVEEEPATYTGRQLAALLLRFYGDWNEALFSGPLWSSLAEGSAVPRVVDGWLIEGYISFVAPMPGWPTRPLTPGTSASGGFSPTTTSRSMITTHFLPRASGAAISIRTRWTGSARCPRPWR
jgi:hypothetical protein